MLRIFSSNRLENLLDEFVRRTATPVSGNPLVPETVIAERGVDRWLWQELARQQQIAANLDVHPPAGFIWQTLRTLLPEAPRQSPYERGALVWRLMALLDPAQLTDPVFAPVRGYLVGVAGTGADGRKRYQLARRLSDLFEQYLVYRHDMVLAWERGEALGVSYDEAWQAQLWRRIVAAAGEGHRARLLDRFFAAARDEQLDAAKLPARVSVFAVPALPPAYLAVLAALGRLVEVHVYSLNPCADFWGDAIRPREQADAFARHGEAVAMQLLAAMGPGGNPLLASGGARIQQYLLDLNEHDVRPAPDLFVYPGDATLLARVQRDIFRNEAPGPAKPEDVDSSIQVHGCYSLLREVEVLHDRLLDAFQKDGSLAPSDILVLTPDVELAAPYIGAVFGTALGSSRDIPYTVTDVPRRSEHALSGAFRQLIALPQSRLTASEVLGLLETPAVARRFGRLGYADLAALRRWVGAAGIRWGLDGADREQQNLPGESAHSWEFGLERLFLGLAMPEDDTLFAGRAPYAEVEGSDGVALGWLATFVERLARARTALARPKPAQAWRRLVDSLLEEFFDAAETAEERVIESISDAAAEFGEELSVAGYDEAIEPGVFRADFEERLAQPARHAGWLRGAVTFARLTPARSLPFRIICLIGMNHDRFPHHDAPATFDLIAAEPRRGDRSRREDDRHLFLEILLSARDRLYISYTDRSLRDSSPQQPSVVVSELIDAVCGSQPDLKIREEVRRLLVTQHPLQPFSVRQYEGNDPRLFSYDRDWVPAALAIGTARKARAPFCQVPLALVAGDGSGEADPSARRDGQIRLVDLHRCLSHPARWFLERRLGVFFNDDKTTELFDEEPFALGDDFAVNEGWLAAALQGRSPDEHFAQLGARGELPAGCFARIDWEERVARFAPLVERLRADAQSYRPLEVDLGLADGRRVVGRLAAIAPAAADDAAGWITQRIVTSVDEPHARLMLGAWIDHLVLCALHGDRCRTRIETRNGTTILGTPPDDPNALLGTLAGLLDASLLQPLRLFPKAAWAYVNATNPAKGIVEAVRKWNGGFDGRPAPERADRWFDVCFGHEDDPLADDEFARLAEQVFRPLLASSESAGASAVKVGGRK